MELDYKALNNPIGFMFIFLIILVVGIVTMQESAKNAENVYLSNAETDYILGDNGSEIELLQTPNYVTLRI
jgi:Na+-transporting methylmalonyl-CoA/oxaloacetate decarboxylase gamma subunit